MKLYQYVRCPYCAVHHAIMLLQEQARSETTNPANSD